MTAGSATSMAVETQTTAPLAQVVQRALVGIEGSAFEASAELVHQRTHFEDARSHDDEHDRLLQAALRVDGLPPLARELILRALHADEREDAAIYERADARRASAHGHTRAIAGGVETLLTGRSR